MDKIKGAWQNKRKYFYIGGGILFLLVVFILARGNGKKDQEKYVVKIGDVVESVELSGKVELNDQADLGFADSGRVSQIYVENNQSVPAGKILAQLEIGSLLADLRIKEAALKTSDIDLESAREELEKVTRQENTKVESAHRTLLSEDLVFIPDSSSYNLEAPEITGSYSGIEGQYKIRVIPKVGSFTDFQIYTLGLETTKREINENGPTPLGTLGLFISFGDNDLALYDQTVWYLNIPNKASSSFTANLNAYEEAQDTRDLAIKNTQTEYDKLLAENQSTVDSVAQAEIEKIHAEIRKNTIYAPFSGRVTNIEKEVGEHASAGERVISVLGEEKLQVILEVPELDVAKLSPGLPISISLDAFPGEKFAGTLSTINSRETEIDGVPVYEVFVELAKDERVKTGMSATGTIILNEKKDVLILPAYMVTKEGDRNFVSVLTPDGNTERREVELGLKGSDNITEVLSGLSEGDVVVSVKE